MMSRRDPSGNNKYLMWMVGQFADHLNDYESIIDTVNKFHKVKNKLPKDKRDLYKYEHLHQLKDEMGKVSDVSKRQQKKIIKKEGADTVFENDKVAVVIPKTHKASCYYGSNTKWCTASKDDSSHFDNYLGKVTLYYILPKDGGEKVAVAVDEHNDKEIFDSGDNGKRLWWLEGKLQQYNIPSSTFKYIPLTGMIRKDDGTILWYLNGYFHRIDGPAYEHPNGKKRWYLNGKLHREDGPAIERPNGTKYWFLNGKLHRKDGPAIEDSDESKEWYLNGKRHRTDGPAYEHPDGTKSWYLNGKLHREDGPAIERADGTKHWYLNGRKHRKDGPAVEDSNGHKEWWLNGMEYPEDKYWQKVGLDKKEEYYKNDNKK
jgi:hypothetical protein